MRRSRLLAPVPSDFPDRSASRRRDRRGRGPRGLILPPDLPGYRDRAEQFDDLVLSAIEFVERRTSRDVEGYEFAVEEVPPAEPSPWERGVRLGAYYPASPPLPPRIVLFRMPIVMRATTTRDLADLVQRVLVGQVAYALVRDPRDIDPDYDEY